MPIDVSKTSCPSPHSFSNKLGRVLWGFAWLALFRLSPRLCYAWRTLLLRAFGARIGRNARISPAVRIWAPWNLTVGDEVAIAHGVDCYCVDRITIGSHATVSQYAFLCTASHDVTDPHMRLTTAPIVITDQAWVCAGAFVGPGVTLGEGAVAGARAVVTRSVAPWDIVAGNPARVIKRRVLQGSERDVIV
jgi:putative colanic acid biosynthesis acetyltransferase WcaF